MFEKLKRQMSANRKFLAQLGAILIVPAVALLHIALFDPRDFSSYNGPLPVPLYLVLGEGDQTIRGPQVTTVIPGQRVTWPTNLCIEHGVKATGHLRLEKANGDGSAILSRSSPIPLARCGEAWSTLTIPAETMYGDYEIHRHISVTGFETRQSLIAHLPETLGHLLEVDRYLPVMTLHVGPPAP